MKSLEIHSPSRYKNRTDLWGVANYPVSCKPVYSREGKFVEIRVYLSPWYRICTKAMCISKGCYRYGDSKNTFLKSVQKLHLPVQDGKLPRLMYASVEPRKKFDEILVYHLLWYRVCTKAMCGTSNYPVSCKPVYCREWKFAEIRVYLSLWYRSCTKAMFISKGSYRHGESKNAFL